MEKRKATHSSVLVLPSVFLCFLCGFPCGSAGKESACKAEDLGSIPRLEDLLEKGKAPLQYSGLENSMDSLWGLKESDRNEQLSLSPFPPESQV